MKIGKNEAKMKKGILAILTSILIWIAPMASDMYTGCIQAPLAHSKRIFYQKGVSSPPGPDFESGVNISRTAKVYSQKVFKIL